MFYISLSLHEQMMTDMDDEASQRGVSPNMYLDPLFEPPLPPPLGSLAGTGQSLYQVSKWNQINPLLTTLNKLFYYYVTYYVQDKTRQATIRKQ